LRALARAVTSVVRRPQPEVAPHGPKPQAPASETPRPSARIEAPTIARAPAAQPPIPVAPTPIRLVEAPAAGNRRQQSDAVRAEPRVSAGRLAAATGGIVSRAPSELSTVAFAPPEEFLYPPELPPPALLARQPAEASAPAPEATEAPAQAAAPAPHAPVPAGAGGPELDDIYDHVLRRLRRDLLREREQMGDLLGDLY